MIRLLKGVLAVFWAGLVIGLLSAWLPPLAVPARWIAGLAGNLFVALATGGVLYVVGTGVAGLFRRT